MSHGRGPQLANDEVLLRRIPWLQPSNDQWCDPESRRVFWQAFRPTKNDTIGISVFLGSMTTPDQIAEQYRNIRKANGDKPRTVYVAEIPFAAVAARVTVVDVGLDGHAQIPELTTENMRAPEAEELMEFLAASVVDLHGPFDP